MIRVTCPSCDKVYELPDHTAGRKARCKACGEAMVVPEAPDELLGSNESASAHEDLTSLYNTTDPSDVVDQSALMGGPAEFNPGTSFQQSTRSSTYSGPPIKLIVAGAGGVVALIVLVVVVVSAMSDGDKNDQDGGADGLAFNATGSVPSGQEPAPRPSAAVEADEVVDLTTEADTGPGDSLFTPAQPDPDTGAGPDEPTTPVTGVGVETEAEPVESADVPEPAPVITQALLSPTSSAYGIVLPEGLELISQTRVAIRTSPHSDGTWLSMEVHKLSGLERRQAGPVSDDGASVLLRGRQVTIPAGVELSEIASDHFAIKRLLYPLRRGDEARRVEYVIKDGPYLISVLGRFPAKEETRLVMLDEAAKSVQKLADQ